jgi:hypothetical protein
MNDYYNPFTEKEKKKWSDMSMVTDPEIGPAGNLGQVVPSTSVLQESRVQGSNPEKGKQNSWVGALINC